MLRGQIWKATLDVEVGPKLYVVVSHNARNKNFDTALCVRLTTTERHSHLPQVVPISPGEIVNGWVACDSLTEIWDDDLDDDRPIGNLSPTMMRTLQPGLCAALGF
ncbi:type II toxin-antitoxin system PemK/MazF family toxin [Rothia halotolerans]|uniref:type II toxin-antitoxin system PemK/MazF family toxin n=1 Tax=Rothia halotolerans TaxID=405770 RepID=UPI001EDECAED|nr:type II toxin-antitoxin system PemK/MazF family toxin [Rothia halotolerans]